MRHDPVEPRGVMGRQSCIRPPEGRLSPPAPTERQVAHLANARRIAPGRGTGKRLEAVAATGFYDAGRKLADVPTCSPVADDGRDVHNSGRAESRGVHLGSLN